MKLKAVAFVLKLFAVLSGFMAFWLGFGWVEQLCWKWFFLSSACLLGFSFLAYCFARAATIVRQQAEQKERAKRISRRLKLQQYEKGEW